MAGQQGPFGILLFDVRPFYSLDRMGVAVSEISWYFVSNSAEIDDSWIFIIAMNRYY